MPTSAGSLRAAVSSLVATADPGLHESPWGGDDAIRDPSPDMHGAYVVTVPTTEVLDPRRSRNDDGIRCRSYIRCRLLCVTRADAAVEDYDAATELEALIIAAVSQSFNDGYGPFALRSIERRSVGDDTGLLVTLEWACDHMLAAPVMGD